MGNRLSFSGQHLELSEIVDHYTDVESSLRSYFNSSSNTYTIRFNGYLEAEVKKELNLRLSEHSKTTILTILSALEAAFRIDYLQRCYKKKKDPLSREFRRLHKQKQKGARVSLEDEIFSAWKSYTSISPQFLGDLKSAFRYRHWLAHGRYWVPKLGQKYDYDSVYLLAQSVMESFPLEGI